MEAYGDARFPHEKQKPDFIPPTNQRINKGEAQRLQAACDTFRQNNLRKQKKLTARVVDYFL